MSELLHGPVFWAMFDDVRSSAQRLEVRSRYAGDQELYDAWAADHLSEIELEAKFGTWLPRVRSLVSDGGRYERVRIVQEPPTDYQRFAYAVSSVTVDAGETIRYLGVGSANRLGLPAHDFWIFDGERVAFMWFTADDRLLGAQLLNDPAVVAQHQVWFDQAAAAATTYADYGEMH